MRLIELVKSFENNALIRNFEKPFCCLILLFQAVLGFLSQNSFFLAVQQMLTKNVIFLSFSKKII